MCLQNEIILFQQIQMQIQTVTAVNTPKIIHIIRRQKTCIFNNVQYVVRCVKNVLFSVVFSDVVSAKHEN